MENKKIYVVIEKNTDVYQDYFTDLKQALNKYRSIIAHLTDGELEEYKIYILECDSMEDAENSEGNYYTVYISQKKMDKIASYMIDEIREDLHAKLAPCDPYEFLQAYCERDKYFGILLQREFDIVV